MQAISCRHAFVRAAGASRSASRRARHVVAASAQKQPPTLSSMDEDKSINAFCSIDGEGKRMAPMTLGEKEQLFLEALSAYYYDGKPSISDSEFDNLKDELLWSGSKVAVLSSDEQRFLEAQIAYNKGKPILDDTEFDKLKTRLKGAGSIITAEGPRCSLRSRSMYSDTQVDYLRMTAINIPAALVVLGAVFSIDDLTGFQITKIIELPEPWGIVALWGVLLPIVYVLSTSITNAVFKDALILRATCPNCGTESTTYFGDILTVSGNRKTNEVKCANPECKSTLTFDNTKRSVTCTPPEVKA